MKDLTGMRLATRIVQWSLLLFAVVMLFPSAYFEMRPHDAFQLLTARVMNVVGIVAILMSSSFNVLLRRIQAIEQKLEARGET